MNYLNTETGEFGVTLSELRKRFPSSTVAPNDPPQPYVGYVTRTPDYNRITHTTREVAPALVDGVLTQQWVMDARSIADVEAEVRAAVTVRVQQRLDEFARTRDYDDMKSLVSYAGDDDPAFNAEGTYGKQVRGQTWRKVYAIEEQAKAGNWPTEGAGQMPLCYEDIEAELPPLLWPNI